MKLNIEVDISDLVDEDYSVKERIEQEIISRATNKLFEKLKLSETQLIVENKYKKKADEYCESLLNHTEWFNENQTAAAITKHLIPQIKKQILKELITDLKNDRDFVATVSRQVLAT